MKKNIVAFNKMKESNEKITWITAYNYPIAHAAEKAGIDMILVGDSGGMVELGYETTNPVTMDEMISFAKAVRRGAPNTFIVGDMPQGSYEISEEEAVKNALRFVKEAGCDAIKLEGGERVSKKIQAIVNAGILVIGHLGLTPQSAVSFGGYKVQGKTLETFESTLIDAECIESAGCCMILLEAMPAKSAEQISKKLKIPIMGIGAGDLVDGQLIIAHDLLGLHPNFRPWFAKCYVPEIINNYKNIIDLQENIKKYGIDTRNDGLLNITILGIKKYIEEVKNRQYPSNDYIYPIKQEELSEIMTSQFWKKYD